MTELILGLLIGLFIGFWVGVGTVGRMITTRTSFREWMKTKLNSGEWDS